MAAPILVLGLGACGGDDSAGAPTHPVGRASATDPGADVYDDNDELTDAPYADIVSIDALRSATKLELRYATRKPLDPTKDPNWVSDSSYTDVLLETTGDDKEDFDVEYGVLDGGLYVDVYRVDTQEEPPVLCTGEAEFSENTHVATVPLDCLGDPDAIGYRVETVYDQEADAEDSLAAYDAAPDAGFVTVH
ncbi:hypothetical protein GCM10010123_35950 [Pilimelia anulata]|uniref:Uncharacterized protein n=1 Tax=Pilimelia anulata TaxID=53371 RepID=A0A8J3BC01_9ACTN|nr:hypothetical protein [Pilimelia anulata]GGK02785.1 hypothetical protein GCM10010123_35950 [Pilimelia anulata]